MCTLPKIPLLGGGSRCIIKCADDSHSLLLKKEYELLEKISDTGCCPKVISYYEENSTGYMVREYIDGETLSKIVGKQPQSVSESFNIIKKICNVLDKLHSLEPPVIVRDIKPENIVINENECVFIDLDAAREFHAEKDTDTVYIGTRTTAAPEQFGYSQTDVRTDIYAVGMLLTYLLTGDYDADKIENKKARSIVRKCTSFNPKDRYKDVEALCRAISNNRPYFLVAAAATVILIAVVTLIINLITEPALEISPTNNYTFTRQASSMSDEMVSDALNCIEAQTQNAVRAGRTKQQMIEFMLNSSQYAVFGGNQWPCTTTDDESLWINNVYDEQLAAIDGTIMVRLDTNSSASMSAGWYISGVVYAEEVSLESYRVYVDGECGNYSADVIKQYFQKHLQAGEHLRIDETRSLSFVSCNDNGFYFIEYGSDDDSDRHLRLRYYTFDEFVDWLNALGKQLWYYEIDENLNKTDF